MGRDSNYVGFHYFFTYVQGVQERKPPFISQILRQFAPLPSFSQVPMPLVVGGLLRLCVSEYGCTVKLTVGPLLLIPMYCDGREWRSDSGGVLELETLK